MNNVFIQRIFIAILAIAFSLSGLLFSAEAASNVENDNIPPSAPIVTSPENGAYLDAQPLVPGGIEHVTFIGTAEPESEIKIIGGVEVATGIADQNGGFAISVPLVQPTGIVQNYEFILIITATDEAGNESPITWHTIIEDSNIPTGGGVDEFVNQDITLVIAESNEEFNQLIQDDSTFAAFDFGGAPLRLFINEEEIFSGEVVSGEEFYYIKILDAAGHNNHRFFTIDKTPPEITLIGENPQTIEAGNTYVELGASAIDAVDGSVFVAPDASAVNTNIINFYTVTYTATDLAGNTATETREVSVVDTTEPSITLTGDNPQTIEAGGAYSELGFTAVDNYDGDISGNVETSTTFIENTIGDFVVSYDVSDSSGNNAETKTRDIQVRDTTQPVITINGSESITIEKGDSYTDAGATALDTFEGAVNVTTSGSVDTNTVDVYTLTYTAEDTTGNEATAKTRTVTVVDTTAPETPVLITISAVVDAPSITIEGSAEVDSTINITGGATPATGTATNGSFSIVVSLSQDAVNTLFITATDDSGNTSGVAVLEITEDSTDPEAPEATPVTGTYNEAQNVTLTISEDATTVRTFYTTDGSEPNENSTEYTGTPIAIDDEDGETKILKAISVDEAENASSITTESYTFDKVGPTAPTADITSGFFNEAQSVTLTLAGDAGTTFYTLGGNDPTEASTAYTGTPISITDVDGATRTLKVRSYDALGNAGDILEENYTFDFTAPEVDGVENGEITSSTLVITFDGGVSGATALLDGASFTDGEQVSAEGEHLLVATDGAGNETSIAFQIDLTVPDIIILGDNPIDIEFGANYIDAGATALDDVDGDISNLITSSTSLNVSTLGEYSVTYSVTDEAGNTTVEERIVNVIDTTEPSITLTGDNPQTIEAGAGYTELGATAEDTFAGDISGDIVINASAVASTTPGTYDVTYSVEDQSGNSTSTTRSVIVVDTTEPTLTLLGDNPQVIEGGDSYTEAGATASDIVDGDLTGSIIITTSSIDTGAVGSYSAVYQVTDAAGNGTSTTREVSVVDTTDPTLTLNGSSTVTLEVGDSYADAGASASDIVDGDITNLITSSTDLDTNTLGAYTVVFEVADLSGNTTSTEREITVVDTTIPVITITGSSTVTHEAGTTYTDLEATALDNYDGDISGDIIPSSTVVEDVIGDYEVRYNVVDSSGNPATEEVRTVEVRDTIVPVIELIGSSSVTTELGQEYTDAGANATDTFDENPVLTSTSTVTTSTLGTYSVTYSAVDASGNNATSVTRVVEVVDTTAPDAPVITTASTTLNADSITIEGTAEANATIDITGGATPATGAADGNGDFSVSVDLTGDAVNTLSVTATDVSDNTSDASTVEVVEDSTPPNAPTADITTGIFNIQQDVTLTTDPSANGTFYTLDESIPDENSTEYLGGTIAIDGVDGTTTTLTVISFDLAGNESSTTIETYTFDKVGPDAPTADITSGDYNAQQDVALTLAGDANQTFYTLDGSTPDENSTEYTSGTIAVLGGEGETKTLQAVSFDTVGNTGTILEESYTFDFTAPIVTGVEDGEITNQNVTISFNEGTALLNGLGIPSDTTLVDQNPYELVVTDSAGNVTTINFEIDKTDPPAPVLTATSTTVNADTILVEGNSSEASTTIQIAGGLEVATGTIDGAGDFSIEVALTEDAVNNLTVTAFDLAGNESDADAVAIIEDSTAPDAPVITTASTTLNADSITIEGTAEANATIDITGGATPATGAADGNGDFSVSVDLTGDAVNTLSVTATDGVENTSDASAVEITEDSTAPDAPIITTEAQTINAATTAIEGTTEANAVISITGGAAPASSTADGAGSFSVEVALTQDAANNLSVTATDIAENTGATSNITITEDSTPPNAPAITTGEQVINANSLLISGTAEANSIVTITGGATTATSTASGGGAYLVSVTLTQDAVNSLEVSATDIAGNESVSSTVAITEDSSGPTITLIGDNPQIIEVGTAYGELSATATDAVDGDVSGDIVIDATAVNVNALGSYDVTYNVDDSAGNSADEVTRTVQVVDSTPPEITILGDNPQITEAGVSYSDPGATSTDNYDGDLTGSIETDYDGLDINSLGTSTVAYSVTDSEGNTASATREVVVTDTVAPTITLDGDNPQTIEAGTDYVELGATAEDTFEGNLTDNIVISTSSVDTGVLGSSTVTYNVADSSGNDAVEVVRNISIVDTTIPEITLNGSSTITLEYGTPYIEPGFTASDSFEGDLAGDVVVGGDTVDVNTTSTFVITYNVSDSSGNDAVEVIRAIIMADTTAPTITLIGSSTLDVEFGSVYTDAGATSTDNVDGDLTANIITTSTVDTGNLGDYSVTFGVSDSSGNAATEVVRTVRVVDTTEPVITIFGNDPETVEGATSYVDAGATATDNYEGDITNLITSSTDLNINAVGSYSTTYEVSDSSGNTTSSTRVINVVDTTAPTITLIGSSTLDVEFGSVYTDAGATSSDTIDGNLTGALVSTSTVDTGTIGAYLVTYGVADATGNSAAEVTRTVNVVDTTAPVITLIGSSTLEVDFGSIYVDSGFSAEDNHDGDIAGSVIVAGDTVDTNTTTTYVVTYDVTDASGNAAAQVTRNVTVVDSDIPVITLTGSSTITLEVGDSFTDPGATAIDNVDGDISGIISIEGDTVNENATGIYVITYNVFDSSGNAATEVTRTVNVVDTTPPQITIVGDNPQTIEGATSYTELGATSTDNYDGNLTGSIVIDATGVDVNALGSYEVSYSVADSSGNQASTTRTVNITDTTIPEITLIGSSTLDVEFGSVYTDAGATALDTLEGDLTGSIVAVDSVNTSVLGTSTVTYNVEDSSGNTAVEVVRSVTVVDTSAPVITLQGTNPQTVEFGTSYAELGATALDNADGDVSGNIVITTSTIDINTLGSYEAVYSVTDSSGNSTSTTRVVNVTDTTAPVGLTLDAVTTLTNITPQSIGGAKEVSSSVWLDGTEIVALDEEVAWSYDLELAEGENAISLTSKDFSENESEAVTSTIIFDTTAPQVTGVSDQASYNVGVTPVFGDENGIATSTLNGAAFSTSTEITTEDTYVLIVTDNASNTTTVNFTLDITVPGTPIIDSVNSPTNETSSTISGTKDAETGIYIDGSEAVAVDGETAWSTEVALTNEGDNTFSVTARDTAGNESAEATTTIVFDTTGPAAPTSSVPEGIYNENIEATLQLAPDAVTTTIDLEGNDPTATSSAYAGGTIAFSGNDEEIKTFKAASFDSLGNQGVIMSVSYTFDKSAPSITLIGSSTIEIEQGREYSDEGATSTDNLDGDLTASITTSTDLNNLIIGNYEIVYSVTDTGGNVASTTRAIEVTPDVTEPEITLIGSSTVEIEQGNTYTDEGATSTDIVDGNLTGSIVTANPVNTNVPGDYSVTYSVTDTTGNTTSTARAVTVIPDQTPPEITLIGASSTQAAGGKTYDDEGATSTDNIDGDITENIIVTNPVNTDSEGNYTVAYNVDDTAGNSATEVTREVSVVNDVTAPVITISGSSTLIVELGSTYFDAGATATDAVDGTVLVVATSSINTDAVGGYAVDYSATDSSGNTATAQRMVNVTDTQSPIIAIIGSKTLNVLASSTYSDAGASVVDNDSNFTGSELVTQNNVNTDTLGIYTVIYEAADVAGNTASTTRTVNVVGAGTDVTAPTIVLNGSSTATVEIGTAFTDEGASALDDTDGDLTGSIVTTSTVNTSVVGEYSVTYGVTDAAGNAAEEMVRTVVVVDTTIPVITIVGNSSINIKQNSTYSDAGANASDNIDGDISTHIIASSTINTSATGTYAVAYNVSDASGNAATEVTRTVNVNELSTPVIENITPTNSPLFILASSSVQMAISISDQDDERVSYYAEITSADPDSNHWPILEKFTPVEPSATLSNFNAIGEVKFTIRTVEYWNNATLRLTARDRDGKEVQATRSIRTRP